MDFWMTVNRRPVSVNTGRIHPNYRAAFQAEADQCYNARGLLDGELYARIVWIHKVSFKLDIDNIVKPILDSLTGRVYADDAQISQVMATRLSGESGVWELQDPLMPSALFERILTFLQDESDNPQNSHIVYVEIGRFTPSFTVGPPDGGGFHDRS